MRGAKQVDINPTAANLIAQVKSQPFFDQCDRNAPPRSVDVHLFTAASRTPIQSIAACDTGQQVSLVGHGFARRGCRTDPAVGCGVNSSEEVAEMNPFGADGGRLADRRVGGQRRAGRHDHGHEGTGERVADEGDRSDLHGHGLHP